ncbi:MAG: RusA family crossover junction endodeoxyribonuclease [Shimia sp.]
MERLALTIPGKPFAKQRPRLTRHGHAYTPAQTVSFERTVGLLASQQISEPMAGPLRITIMATFQPPRSWSKKKTAAHLGRYHTQRPDTDNLAKAICDGLNRIAYADDAQLAWVDARKVWGPVAQTIVRIERLEFSAKPLVEAIPPTLPGTPASNADGQKGVTLQQSKDE